MLTGLGNQLIETHVALREQIADIRDGGPRALQTHCLAFCAALTAHHTDEDQNLFRVLAEQFPQLRPILDELVRDHVIIADLLRRLATAEKDQLDGLAALLESHFTYEERKLVDLLNSLPPAEQS